MSRLVTELINISRSHYICDRTIDVVVELDGATYTLVGTSTVVVDLGVKLVELLRSDSSPQRQFVAGDAESRFLEAASHLVESGRPFYTCLRGGWRLPAYDWEMKQ